MERFETLDAPCAAAVMIWELIEGDSPLRSKPRRNPSFVWICGLLWLVSACVAQHASIPESAEAGLRDALDAARSGDLPTAINALERGALAWPRDPRFPIELAGIAFLQKDLPRARRLLHLARRLGSEDPYVGEFLGTLYLLDENIEAALALWNPVGKPTLVDGQMTTGLEEILRPGLASEAAAFPAALTFTRDHYLRTERIVALLGVCGLARVHLEARPHERYQASVRCVERPGFGRNPISSLVMLSRGLAYQSVHIAWPNIAERAWNLHSLARWDARKRRLWAAWSMPLAGKPAWQLGFDGDARHEYWQALEPETRTMQQTFLQRRVEAGIAVAAVVGSRATWRNRVSVANRSFPLREAAAPDGMDERLFSGSSVRYAHDIEVDVYRNPTHRLFATLDAGASMERYLALRQNVYRAETALTFTWLPLARGNDGRTRLRLAGGTLRGTPALPELFNVGLERDGAIPLRAHVGTRDGYKGSALYGDRYLSSNLEVEKTLARLGVVTLSIAPFLDVAWLRDPLYRYGARRTQFDAGLQWIVATPSGTEVRLSYGWDLRNKRRAFYAWSEPFP